MRKIRLQRGSHDAPFGEDDTPTMCAAEYCAYLAGESHSDAPKCVSPVLNAFTVPFNDALPDEKRQRLLPMCVRQLGTAGDSQDEVRTLMALDWLIRTYVPAFLAAAGLTDEADKLRGLAAIEDAEQARWAIMHLRAAGVITETRAGNASGAALIHVRSGARAAEAAAGDAAWTARTGGGTGDAIWTVLKTVAALADEETLERTVDGLHESAFALLARMLDPAGMHDIPMEEECFEQTGRERMAHA